MLFVLPRTASRLWRNIFTKATITATGASTSTVTSPSLGTIRTVMTSSKTSYSSVTSSKTTSSTIHVSKHPTRSAIPDEALSNPHHVMKGGTRTTFKNPYPAWGTEVTIPLLLRRVIWPSLTGEIKRPDLSPPTVTVVKPQWLPDRTSSDKLRATWLGHACYYVEYPSGLRVLFDPVFEDRCSPFTFMGPKRFTKAPCDIKDIPLVDLVVISHSHYDHLSITSVLQLQKNNPDVHFFVGLGLEKWFRDSGLRNVTELDWWEDADVSVKVREGGAEKVMSARISCLPAQHTSKRAIFDQDTTLWCSWAVESSGKSVWFGGDTGYRAVPNVPAGTDDYGPEFESLPRCPQFKQIGDLRGPFDLGLIPIGAYSPRFAFSSMHANPFDSVEIFADTRCKRAMGIHWGTWALTLERVLEPPLLLKEALKRKGIPETGVFDVCDIGESREF